MNPIRSATALLVAATAVLTIASTALAVTFDPTILLRTTPSGVGLHAGDIAAESNVIGVAWEESGPAGIRSYLRRSDDGGASYEPRRALRDSGQAYDPQVAVCDTAIHVVSSWPTPSGNTRVGYDFWGDPLGGPDVGGSFALPGARGVDPDVACAGSAWRAFAWFDETTSHVKLRLIYRTDVPGKGPTQADFDLGPGRLRHGLSVAMTDRMAYVAFKPDSRIVLRRFAIDFDHTNGLAATARPPVTVLTSAAATRPLIAAEGPEVALAYGFQGDSRARFSTDRGKTFGAVEILYQAPCIDCEAGSLPTTIDVHGPYVLVEVVAGGPAAIGSIGFLSADDGNTWAEISTRQNARPVGALFEGDEADFVVEAWDNALTTGPGVPPTGHGRLRIHTGALP